MIRAWRIAVTLGALLLVVSTVQSATAHDVEDNAAASYTFGATVSNLALGAKLEQDVVNAGAPIAIKLAIMNFGPPIIAERASVEASTPVSTYRVVRHM
jgi:hypothetical protein